MNLTWPTWTPVMIDSGIFSFCTPWRSMMSLKLRTAYSSDAPTIGPITVPAPPRINATQTKNVTSVMKLSGCADCVAIARSIPPIAPNMPPMISACIL